MTPIFPPLVSCIITTNNRPDFIGRAIKSVLNQTYENIELIVVDSSDDSKTEIIINKLDTSKIIYKKVFEKNAGKSRNIGVSISNGEYISFLDDDDIWYPEKIKKQLSVIEQSNEKLGLVYCWVEYFDEGKNEINYYRKPQFKGYIFKNMISKNAITMTSSLLINKNAFLYVKGFDERFSIGQDTELIRSISMNYNIDYVPEILLRYIINHKYDQITGLHGDKIEKHLNTYHLILNKYSSFLYTYKKEFSELLINISIAYFKLKKYKMCYKYTIKGLKHSKYSFNILFMFVKGVLKT